LVSNAAVECTDRPVDFMHIPTLGSSSDEFFRPMAELKANGARIYMGAIHHLHGPEGMKAQLEAIRKYIPEFGLAAPCGFGRAPERPGKLLSETGEVRPDYIDIILKDHKSAVATLAQVGKH